MVVIMDAMEVAQDHVGEYVLTDALIVAQGRVRAHVRALA